MSLSKNPVLGPAILLGILAAQSPLFAKQYSFKTYGPLEGLKNQSVTCLLEDRRGVLWVGTENGLFRYDGPRFTQFGSADGLPDSTIQSLHQAPDGTLWVGTRVGLAFRNGDHFTPDPMLGKVDLYGYSNIVSSPDGTLFVGTALGLAVGRKASPLAPVRFYFETHDPVFAVTHAPSGAVFFAAHDHLWEWNNGTVTDITGPQHLPKDLWDSLLVDHEGDLWVRSTRRLLVRHAGSDHFEIKANIPYSADMGTLYQTSDGHVFVPTEHGLIMFKGDHQERLGTDTGLAVNAVGCVLQDHEGSVWIGLRGTGLVRWLGFETWEGWKSIDGLTSDVIWDVKRDHAGTLWVATNDGLNALDPVTQRFRAWPPRLNTRGFNVRCLLDDPDGDALWFGTQPGGLYRLDRRTGRLTQFGAAVGLENDRVNNIIWDRDHHLWVGTEEGLFRGTLTGTSIRFDRPQLPFSHRSEAFNGLSIDHDGRLWVGGSSGLLALEADGWHRFSTSDGLAAENVSQVAETPDGAIWVTYLSNSGISRLSFAAGRTSVQTFSTANGLASNGSIFLGLDTRKWLWVGSDNGLDVYRDGLWKHFGQSDGLIWDDVDAIAFFADQDGSVWVGTSLGLSRYRLPDSTFPDLPPVPFITSVKAGAHRRDPNRFFSADYLDRSVGFSFSSSTHLNEPAVRFRIRLVGFDRDWVETNNRTAFYSNLPAGQYTFEVLCRSAAGQWSRQSAKLSFRILTPWWQSWAFRTGLACTLVAVTALLWRSRVRMLVRKQTQLEELLRQAELADRLKTEAFASVVKAEALQRSRSKVLELVGSRAPLESTLDSLIDVIEVEEPSIVCAIYRVSGEALLLTASRRLPNPIQAYFTATPVALRRFTCEEHLADVCPEYSKLIQQHSLNVSRCIPICRVPAPRLAKS